MAVIKTEALYKQVANEMRASITSGQWPAGTQIPPEEQLSAAYDVSRPTVRQAVAALRTEGLLDVHQGKGSFVRDRHARSSAVMEQDITRSGTRYTTGADGEWTTIDKVSATFVRIDAEAAAILDITKGEDAYAVEYPLLHQATGTRAMHRMILPVERITGTPLAKNAAVIPAKAYAILATAHGDLEWRETVGARMPQPDERATLQIGEGVPLLISQRLTLAKKDRRRPLILETLRLGAGGAQLAYTLNSFSAPDQRPDDRG
jgi:GntR family transcriptional regulator